MILALHSKFQQIPDALNASTKLRRWNQKIFYFHYLHLFLITDAKLSKIILLQHKECNLVISYLYFRIRFRIICIQIRNIY